MVAGTGSDVGAGGASNESDNGDPKEGDHLLAAVMERRHQNHVEAAARCLFGLSSEEDDPCAIEAKEALRAMRH